MRRAVLAVLRCLELRTAFDYAFGAHPKPNQYGVAVKLRAVLKEQHVIAAANLVALFDETIMGSRAVTKVTIAHGALRAMEPYCGSLAMLMVDERFPDDLDRLASRLAARFLGVPEVVDLTAEEIPIIE